MGKSEIDQIIANAWGGDSKAAQAALGVTKQTISDWRRKGIPKLRRYQIADLTSPAPTKVTPDSPTEPVGALPPA